MKLYSTSSNTLSHVKPAPFSTEREMQELCESNLDALFGLQLVKSEFRFQSFRFDTLCFDEEAKAFVIIEYKKGKSFSVIDQGFSYLSAMLDNKAEFVLEYNEILAKKLKRSDVDWTQSRILFVSPEFSDFQRNAVNFKNVPFELWECSRFANDIVAFSQVKTTSQADINEVGGAKMAESSVRKVSKEVKRYTEEDYLNGGKRPAWVLELYQELKERILNLGEGVEMKVKKVTIGFKQNKGFVDISISNSGFYVVLNLKKGALNDPAGLAEDVSAIGHWGSGDYRVYMQSDENLDYVVGLIRQSFKNQV